MIISRPPMGWNSWNTFGPDINEKVVKESADKMVSLGLRRAGYEYLVIDDCWALRNRDENGRMVPDPEKFPSGMKAVADYVHSKGLKFGMYSCAGSMTCASYPGSFDYEFIDAETFASWGIDYLKYDYCFKPVGTQGDQLYRRMGIALANCGRDILFSACSWGAENTPEWIKTTGAHIWRSTGDVMDSWESVKVNLKLQKDITSKSATGCFSDLDMLVVGMGGKGNVAQGGCTPEEYRTHFSAWALYGSPLMIGCDLRKMSTDVKKLLTNKDVIAIDQDPAARQPFYMGGHGQEAFWANDDIFCMAKLLEGGDIAIGMFNLSDGASNMVFQQRSIGLDRICGVHLEMKELWTGEETRTRDGQFILWGLPAHQCKLYRCKVVKD
ncbi:MAG: glycoside hydrolase family 27 protein [Clostridia bacterium]|nr:glycoside hydrolase family 27 protein [Clostridia bacterium]